jgi:hypothetical protein
MNTDTNYRMSTVGGGENIKIIFDIRKWFLEESLTDDQRQRSDPKSSLYFFKGTVA